MPSTMFGFNKIHFALFVDVTSECTPRSPDLTTLDIFIENIKIIMSEKKPKILEELKEGIRNVSNK